MSVNLRVLSIAAAVCLGMLGAIQLASPESLGISPVAARWLGIVAAGLGILQGFLPRVQGPSTDPDVIAERIFNMAPNDRQTLIHKIEQHSLDERIGHLEPWQQDAIRKDLAEDSRRPTTEIRSHIQ